MSGTKLVFKSMLTATVPSSTYLTFSDLDFEIGPIVFLGMGGLKKAPLNFMIKIKPPKKVPWGPPPGNFLSVVCEEHQPVG